MEKIYEQKSQNQNNKRKLKIDGTTVLSFAVALFAIVSLVTVGFNQISYAIPEVQQPFGDEFYVNDYSDTNPNAATERENKVVGANSNFTVFPYYALVKDEAGTETDRKPVYCLEYDVQFTDGGHYSKESGVEVDGGLLYLLANLHPHNKIKNGSADVDDSTATWITQTAIWIYLSEKGDTGNQDLTKEKIAAIRAETALNKGHDSTKITETINLGTGKPLYDNLVVYADGDQKTINELITKAKSLPAVAKAVKVDKNDTISLSNDGKYYFTDVIAVKGIVSDKTIGVFNGFSLKITKAPEGTIITDKDGVEIKDTSNLAPGTEFYIRIPVDKVTEDNKKVEVDVSGSFKSFLGYGYRVDNSAESQRITLVNTVNNNVHFDLDVDVNYSPRVPDTGMTTAQSIYFIGLVVLLCGVGIVYANAKPATNKQ